MQATLVYNNFALLSPQRMSTFAVIGSCIYIAAFTIPFNFKLDIPLIILSLTSVLAALSCLRTRSVCPFPFAIPVFVFLLITAVSIILSQDIGRSVKLSAPLLPAMLLFFLVAGYFDGIKNMRLLYFTFSVVVLGLSSMLLWSVLSNANMDPFVWVSRVGSPVLVVKNDVTFLSVVTPLSLALLYLKPRSVFGVVATLSVLLSVAVVGIFQSRGAMLIMIASVTCFFFLIKPRIGLAFGITTILLLLLVDGFMGFPLIERFIRDWDGNGRIPLWVSAWEMFLDRPLLGHGPHTFVLFYGSYLHNLSLPSWLFIDPRIIPWPHNLYLEVLSEQGISGLTALGFLLACGLSAGKNLQRLAVRETQILGYGAFAGLVGFCLAAAIELTFLRQWVVITMFLLLGVIARLSSSQKKTKEGKECFLVDES